MGSWSYEVLENNEALDMMYVLENSNNIENTIQNYLDKSTCINEQLLAVEIVDISLNGIDRKILGSLYEYLEWFEDIVKNPMTELIDKAIETINNIKKYDYRLGWNNECIAPRNALLDNIKNRLTFALDKIKEKDALEQRIKKLEIELDIQKDISQELISQLKDGSDYEDR